MSFDQFFSFLTVASYSSSDDDYSTTDGEGTTTLATLSELSDTSITSPFKLKWAYGFNSSVPVINLGSESRFLLAYACSHTSILYDYDSRVIVPLRGHRYYVRSMAVDVTGKWLLTADSGPESSVIVWDSEKGTPAYVLFNPYEKKALQVASISWDAKYVITVGSGRPEIVKIWEWATGKQTPAGSAELIGANNEVVKDICFNLDFRNIFCFTKNSQVIYLTWNEKEKKFSYCIPVIQSFSKSINSKLSHVGIFNNSIFVKKTTKGFTATSNGFVLVWSAGDKDFVDEYELISSMRHVKTIPLQNANLTTIVNYVSGSYSMIVTGNSKGDINFYDEHLQILYWCRKFGFDGIASISFDFHNYLICPEKSDSDIASSLPNKKYSPQPSNVTLKTEYPPKPQISTKSTSQKIEDFKMRFEKYQVPRDATIQNDKFYVDKFIVSTFNGKLAWVDINSMEYRFISNYCESPITAIDTHPKLEYLAVANDMGKMFLINYCDHRMMLQQPVPPLPDLMSIFKEEGHRGQVIHISNIEFNKNAPYYATVLRYSFEGNDVIAGMSNGIMWVLQSNTLEASDPYPYKHSNAPIKDIIFSECSNYLAYFDEAHTVAVFRRSSHHAKAYAFKFIGKYRSHKKPIRTILFGPTISANKTVPRLLTLGEDRDLVEYDLSNSGPYPDPGLVVKEAKMIDEIMPLNMTWYSRPYNGIILIVANADYKLKLVNARTKETLLTTLGPRFSSPIKTAFVKEFKEKPYLIFATSKEIGLQMIPFDGNPFKCTAMIGHPCKVTSMRLSFCGKYLFTTGCNDHCILMWKINVKTVENLYQTAGSGMSPFYGFIIGQKDGWLYNEMQELFIFAQILQQGENSMKTRQIAEDVAIEQLPNLVRAVGYFPSIYQVHDLLNEAAFPDFEIMDEPKRNINFEEYLKLYINHRPAYGILMTHIKQMFHALGKQELEDDFTLDKHDFVHYLQRRASIASKSAEYKDESLSAYEVETYLKNLTTKGSAESAILENMNIKKSFKEIFDDLPQHISYKDFAANIMGVELSKKARADKIEI